MPLHWCEKTVSTLLLFFLPLTLVIQDPKSKPTWPTVKQIFNKRYKASVSAEKRLEIVSLLADVQTPNSVELLVKALDLPYAIIQATEKSLRGIEEELFRIQQERLSKPKRRPSIKTENRIKSLNTSFWQLGNEVLKEKKVIEKIIQAFSETKNPAVLAWLTEYATKNMKISFQRLTVLQALAKTGADDIIDVLLSILNNKKPQFRVSAINALGCLKSEETLLPIIASLKDECWQVRLSAISVLSKWKERESVPALVEALRQEKGRLRESIARALCNITGKTFGLNYQAWKDWISEKDDTNPWIEVSPMPSKLQGDSKYYGITTYSKRIVFIIDCSETMGWSRLKPREGRTTEPKIEGVITIKIETAKKELCRFIKSYEDDGYFNIIAYGTDVIKWQKGMIRATRENKESAYKFIERLCPSTLTNMYGALEAAFNIAGIGATDKNYKTGADTIFFLSDGWPTIGVTTDMIEILKAVREWNSLRRIEINTIGIGTSSKSRRFLDQLALENGGEFTTTY